jgi:hypothetical protein
MTDPNKIVTWEGEKRLEPSPCGGSRYVVDCPDLAGSFVLQGYAPPGRQTFKAYPHDQFCRWAG